MRSNPRRESILKSKLMEELATLKGYLGLRHEDFRTAGIPDITLTGAGRTWWIEVKHATPNFDSTGIQELRMKQLAGGGWARYVVYWESGDLKRTLIIHPRQFVRFRETGDAPFEASCVGHSHAFVRQYFQEEHRP